MAGIGLYGSGLLRQRRMPSFRKSASAASELPSLGEFGAFAARTAVGRQVVKADVHGQRHAFAKRDRLLGAHARQRRQHARAPHPATPSRMKR